MLGYVTLDQERPVEAERFLCGVLDLRTKLYGGDHPRTHRARIELGRCLQQLGRYDEAIVLLETALDGLAAMFVSKFPRSVVDFPSGPEPAVSVQTRSGT